MSTKSVLTKKRLVVLTVVLFLLFGIWRWHRWATGYAMIPDAELTELFLKNRRTFEQLLQMAGEDNFECAIGRTYFGRNYFIGRCKNPPERLDEYHDLMRKAEVVLFAPDPDYALFWVDDQHSAIGGRLKGIYYKDEPKSPVRPSLDVPCLPLHPDAESCSGVRHIDGNWWLLRIEDR